MLKRNDEHEKSRKRVQPHGTEAGSTHPSRHSEESDSVWRGSPEWAIEYKTPTATGLKLISLATKMAELQKVRETNLGVELSRLGESAWKILIELVIAKEKRNQISAKDISNRTLLPEAIADRYINILEDMGHVIRSQHHSSRHEDRVSLTHNGHSLMRKTLVQLDTI